MRWIAVSLMLWCSHVTNVTVAQDRENLARSKAYTLHPQPNYLHCTDPQDKLQLTDGIYTQGYFWTQQSTVGWQNALPATITFDLESIQPICGILFHTAAGVAGVQWPLSIHILVSDDGKTYFHAGDLVEFSAVEHGAPKAEGYGLHCFRTETLRTHGRFVKLLIIGNGPFIFADEIEIFKGPREFIKLKPPGEKVDDINQFNRRMTVIRAVRRRLRLDLAEIRKLARELNQKKWENDFQAIEKEISALHFNPPSDFRTVFPMNDLHRRIFAIQAALWRTRGWSDLIVWQKNRWDMLSPTELPKPQKTVLEIHTMSNEYRGAAFNLSNADSQTLEAKLSIEGLPGGTNPNYITVHEIPFTDTRSGIPIAAAMPIIPKQQGKYFLTVEPGLTKQIWFTLHPQTIPPGEYAGKIILGLKNQIVPIRLKIYPFRFPDQPTLSLGGWDYTDQDNRYQVTSQNCTALIQHLREHFVDSPWATSRVLSRGKYDKEGNMIEEPDPQYFRQWLQRWPKARNYLVFAAVGNSFSGFKIGTPAFQNAVAHWIDWWAVKLKQWNLRPEQLGLLLVDEPHTQEQDNTIIEYAKVIQKAAPGVVIWNDPTWREPWEGRPQLFELSDVLCPNLPMLITQGNKFADFYEQQRDAGRQLWFYSCSGPGKLLDPYSYHRLQHWFCWKYQAQGSGFWAFGDSNGASSWNEYLTLRGAYTPVFLDETSVTPGKHMEAIREGIEDYEYLVLLRQRITELENQGKTEKTIEDAKQLLTTAADRVTKSQTAQKLSWRENKDRTIADAVRIEVLELLMKLQEIQ